MQINFLTYFQIEAAANGNVPYLLSLELLLANSAISKQEELEKAAAVLRSFEFEKIVDPVYRETNENGERNGQVG